MKQIFKTLHHICVVVNDIEATERAYLAAGIGPWYDYPQAGAYIEYDVPDVAASKSMRYRCVDLDNIQIQLCQPSSLPSPQRHFLETFGEGVYHLGFEVPDRDEAETQGRALGLGVISRGKRADGSGFCYFDTKTALGIVLEIRKTSETASTHGNATDHR